MQIMYLKIIERQDLERFVELCRNFHQHSPYTAHKFDPSVVIEMANTIIDSNKMESVAILLMDDNDVAQGMIVGVSSSLPFSKDKIGLELVWWVEEAYRGTRKSIEMALAYKDWTKRIGCSLVQMSMLTNTNTDKIDKMYNKLGLHLSEQSYLGVI